MTLDPRKWTNKTAEAVSAAMQAATAAGHPELTPHHVMIEIVRQEGTVVAPLLAKLEVSAASISEKCASALAKLPSAKGGSEPRLNRELSNAFADAAKLQDEFGDDFLSVELLAVAMHDIVGVARRRCLLAAQSRASRGAA